MKLVDLNPKFLGARHANGVTEKAGVDLDCPCGKCGHRLYVPFKVPIGPGDPYMNEKGWNRTGETFETLTLEPSILRIGLCGWHGYITNGEIRTV